ncbi:MAG: hypothetical protein L3J06_04150 [Cyclobacteriaceae bacterium]|nr:hypothetical protein [Cyclobacteriaceae bacterium]
MAITRKNTDIPKQLENVKVLKAVILLAIPFIGMAAIMTLIMFKQNLNIIFNTSEYKPSIFEMDSISCLTGGSSSASSDRFCNAYGHAEDILTSIDLGYDFEVDFDKKYYPVFYRPDGKLTLIREEDETVFDNSPYVKTAMLQLGLPLITIILLIGYYRNLTKKIKKHEQEKTNLEH